MTKLSPPERAYWGNVYTSHWNRCNILGITPLSRLKFDYVVTNSKRHLELLESSKIEQPKNVCDSYTLNPNYSHLI